MSNYKRVLFTKAAVLSIGLIFYFPGRAQDTTRHSIDSSKPRVFYQRELYPNMQAKAMSTPTGWGSWGTFLFGYLGGTFPQAYTNQPDLVAGVGFGFGDSYKGISVVSILNINNVSDFKTFSASFIASRHIGQGTSLSVGALNILANKVSDATAALYVAVSHASQEVRSKEPGYSGLSYTIGVGSGRFWDNSPQDISKGRSEHGTGVFGNISYGILKGLNLNAEWDGNNMGLGASWRPPSLGNSHFQMPSFSASVVDLLRTSGDRPRLLLSIAQAITLSKKSK